MSRRDCADSVAGRGYLLDPGASQSSSTRQGEREDQKAGGKAKEVKRPNQSRSEPGKAKEVKRGTQSSLSSDSMRGRPWRDRGCVAAEPEHLQLWLLEGYTVCVPVLWSRCSEPEVAASLVMSRGKRLASWWAVKDASGGLAEMLEDRKSETSKPTLQGQCK